MPSQSSAGPSNKARPSRWTPDRIVTFAVTLAATASVTRAAAAAGLSRKSAYARRNSDAAFAALWDRALAASALARRQDLDRRRPDRRKGDKVDEVDEPPNSLAEGDGRDLLRLLADRECDLLHSRLELHLPAALRENRIANPLAKAGKPSDAGRFEERRERLWSDSGAR